MSRRQRKSMNVPFVERTKKTRSQKGSKISGGLVEARSQNVSEDRKTKKDLEIHRSPAPKVNQAERGTEGNRIKRLTSESTLVEQGHNFATSTGTLDREEMSKLSDVSIDNLTVRGSPIDNSKMHEVTEKVATSSSFSERNRNTLGNFFPFTMQTELAMM